MEIWGAWEKFPFFPAIQILIQVCFMNQTWIKICIAWKNGKLVNKVFINKFKEKTFEF